MHDANGYVVAMRSNACITTMHAGNIVALITGGEERVVQAAVFTSNSAANSYDQDENVLQGAATNA